MRVGGIPLFTKIFSEKWKHDDNLLSGFLSAINLLGNEIFDESIDRIKFKDHIILLKIVDPLSVCYVIKGQSYPAQQRLNEFTQGIKNNQKIWKTLNQSIKTGYVLSTEKLPDLGTLVNQVFAKVHNS